jgi:CysZ protein
MRFTLDAIMLSLRQLSDAETLAVLWRVVLLTLLAFAVIGAALWWAGQRWLIPMAGTNGDLADLAALGLAVVILTLFWLLFRSVAMAAMGLFTDRIIESVEEDHYPAAAARAVPVPWRRGLAMGLWSGLRALGWNLLASPIYLVLLFTGIGLPIALLLVNGLLLGRDLELMVASRHPGAAALPNGRRHTLGFVAALAFMIPGLNLVAPVFGAALAVHFFHRTEGLAR